MSHMTKSRILLNKAITPQQENFLEAKFVFNLNGKLLAID